VDRHPRHDESDAERVAQRWNLREERPNASAAIMPGPSRIVSIVWLLIALVVGLPAKNIMAAPNIDPRLWFATSARGALRIGLAPHLSKNYRLRDIVKLDAESFEFAKGAIKDLLCPTPAGRNRSGIAGAGNRRRVL
jgi:hypothetical protein